MCSARAVLSLLLVLVSYLCYSAGVAAETNSHQGSKKDDAQLTCKPQGLLTLDHPYPKPRRTHGLPICPQYSCSCCSKQHVAHIYRLLAPAMMSAYDTATQQQQQQQQQGKGRDDIGLGEGAAGDEEEDGVVSQSVDAGQQQGEDADLGLSSRCADMLTLMACRACDPEVGVGLKPAVCRGTCNAWYAACKHHYFTFEPLSGLLVGCPAGGPGPGTALPTQAMCGRMEDMVVSGEQLCELAGMPVADPSPGMPCFNGADPRMPPGVCDPPLESASSAQQTKKPDKKKKQHGKKAGGKGEGSLAWWKVIFGVLCGVALIAPWGWKVARGFWDDLQLTRAARRAQQQQQQQRQQAPGSTQRHPQAFKGKGRFAR